ncbi:Serine/threonine-protein kinase CTR1 [Zea mays]|uniref:Serine/threonine-protein kinase CTR1 n=1 Tax=Zea mays TaxID=4577 RepID=A0A1D6H9N7_MAIZE|nr:Serine/threonine-protein kinase CTR1 [Zea mays]
MRKRMESDDDLIEEAKLRTVWWALCIFAVSYFLTRDVAWAVCPGDRRGGAGPARRRGCRRSRRGDPDPDDLERP